MLAEHDLLERGVVREHRDADLTVRGRVGRRAEERRAPRDERIRALLGPVVDRERIAGVEQALCDRLAHLPEAEDRDRLQPY